MTQEKKIACIAQETEADFIRLMNGIIGSVVRAMIFGIGIQGICSSRKMKERVL